MIKKVILVVIIQSMFQMLSSQGNRVEQFDPLYGQSDIEIKLDSLQMTLDRLNMIFDESNK